MRCDKQKELCDECILQIICVTVCPLGRAQQELHIPCIIVTYNPWTCPTLKEHNFLLNTFTPTQKSKLAT